MKTIICPICEANRGRGILDEHQCNGGFVDVPTNTGEWAEIQQPFLYPKEEEQNIKKALKMFLFCIKNGSINIDEYEF